MKQPLKDIPVGTVVLYDDLSATVLSKKHPSYGFSNLILLGWTDASYKYAWDTAEYKRLEKGCYPKDINLDTTIYKYAYWVENSNLVEIKTPATCNKKLLRK
jgi:hypothetical protein